MYKQENKNKLINSRLTLVKGTPRLKTGSGEKIGSRIMFKKIDVIKCSLGLCMVLILTVLLTPYIHIPSQHLKIGHIATKNIKSPADFLIKDKLSTEKNKIQAALDQNDIYDFDSKIADKIIKKVSSAFVFIRSAYFLNISDFTYEEEKEEIDEILQTESILQQKKELKEKIVEFEKSDLFKQIESDFIEKLGISLNEKAYKTLKWHHYKPEIDKILVNFIKHAMADGVVSDKKLLDLQKKKNILIKELSSDRENIIRANRVHDMEGVTTMISRIVDNNIEKRHPLLRKALVNMAQKLITPNLTFNKKETEGTKLKAIQAVKPVFFQIKKGEMIVREGEPISQEHIMKLEAMKPKDEMKKAFLIPLGIAVFIGLILYLVWFYLNKFKREVIEDKITLTLLSSILIINFGLIRFFMVVFQVFAEYMGLNINSFSYAIPYAAGTVLVSILFEIDMAIVFSLLTFFLVGLLMEGGYSYSLIALTGGLAATFRVNQFKRRSDILKTGIIIGVINMVTILPLGIINYTIFSIEGVYDIFMGFAGGILIAIVVSIILPILESLFKVTSDIRLLELADTNHPVLTQMVVLAPGTYQHSHLVASLSEEAADAIGANPLLVRVGSYFHDIGKMCKAEYFIENQQKTSTSKHDSLTPNMSSLVLTSHVKDGIELAKKYKLVPRIVDFIREHHGDGVITYFYNKAKEQNNPETESIKEQDFRYSGPKPRTKETAIVMLADSVEAASRSLEEPTPSRLNGLVHDVINSKFIDGQLDNCELSFKDLSKIAESFNRILIGIFHFRIDYNQATISNDSSKNDEKQNKKGNDYGTANSIEKQSNQSENRSPWNKKNSIKNY